MVLQTFPKSGLGNGLLTNCQATLFEGQERRSEVTAIHRRNEQRFLGLQRADVIPIEEVSTILPKLGKGVQGHLGLRDELFDGDIPEIVRGNSRIEE